MRKPQLDTVKADQIHAQINYEKATLALSHTSITLPFDVIVLENLFTISESISQGTTLANLILADVFWLDLKIPLKHLTRIVPKSPKHSGSFVSFKFNGYNYQGEVISVRVNLSETTRMGGIIVEIFNKQPLNGRPSLIIGSHIDASVQAGLINQALKIPVNTLINNNQLYVVDEKNTLQIRDITILWQLPDGIIIQADLSKKDRIIISHISGIAVGSLVNVRKVDSHE